MKKNEISKKAIINFEKAATSGYLQEFFKHYSWRFTDRVTESKLDIVVNKELKPLDSHKSFYKKAYISNGYFNYSEYQVTFFNLLISYKTIVCGFFTYYEIDRETGELIERLSEFIPLYYGGYDYEYIDKFYGYNVIPRDSISATTLRHIKAYCNLNKAEYINEFNTYWIHSTNTEYPQLMQ